VAPAADLCVVVLSYRNEDTVLDALDSLLAQDEPVELVVSHSGGGPTPALLAERHPAIPVFAQAKRRLPGAARNAGVAGTRAPFVAFLAADCRALPGWVAGRLAHHRAGAGAVASALVPHSYRAPSLASFLLQHNTRMQHLQLAPHFRFGVSYERTVLDRHGPFVETLRHGEDVAMNTRLLMAGTDIVFAPDVLTAHVHPTSVRELLSDQFRRGQLRAALAGDVLWQAISVGHVLTDAPAAIWRGSRPNSALSRWDLVRVAPLLLAGALATAAGTARGGLQRDAEGVRQANLRRQLRFSRALRRNGR
jgi:GT2 family glycosyltransferase